MVRGIRGAITVRENCSAEIIQASQELIEEMTSTNGVHAEDIAVVLFSLTPDLNDVFPAEAARKVGWKDVPLFCCKELDVPGALKRCLRILILVNTRLKQDEIKHIYLREAKILREDL